MEFKKVLISTADTLKKVLSISLNEQSQPHIHVSGEDSVRDGIYTEINWSKHDDNNISEISNRYH